MCGRERERVWCNARGESTYIVIVCHLTCVERKHRRHTGSMTLGSTAGAPGRRLHITRSPSVSHMVFFVLLPFHFDCVAGAWHRVQPFLAYSNFLILQLRTFASICDEVYLVIGSAILHVSMNSINSLKWKMSQFTLPLR